MKTNLAKKVIATKTDYILKSIQKISHKKWEFYIVTRIIHSIPDDIEFVTQQLVRRTDGTRALTDLYFPQFNLHLEIDEPAHENPNQKKSDQMRENDIVQITQHEMWRIKILGRDDIEKSLADIKAEVDEFIKYILSLKRANEEKGLFEPWDYEHRYSPEVVIKRGYISIADNVVFRRQIDAMKCFGFQGNGWQRGAWNIPESDDSLWFPRLYEHNIWVNELSADGLTISEKASKDHLDEAVKSLTNQKADFKRRPNGRMIVFAKGKDALGFNLLRYVGTFKANLESCSDTELIFDRVSDSETVRV